MANAAPPKPVTRSVRNSEFLRKIDHYLQAAQREPIEITRRGSRYMVLMSAERYDQLQAATQRSFYAHELPESLIEVVERAEMDPRHEALDKLMK